MKSLIDFINETKSINESVRIPQNVIDALYAALDDAFEIERNYAEETPEELEEQWDEFVDCPTKDLREDPLFILWFDNYLVGNNPGLIEKTFHVKNWEQLPDDVLEQFRELMIEYAEENREI